MNNTKYRWMLYAIVVVIVTTISIQVYWNYNNYLTNKQQLINDVQVSLDKSIEAYYVDLAKESTFAYSFEGEYPNHAVLSEMKTDSIELILKDLEEDYATGRKSFYKFSHNTSTLEGVGKDSIFTFVHNSKSDGKWETKEISINGEIPFPLDSIINFKDFENLTSRVIISMTRDSLKLRSIDSLLSKEFLAKSINLNYGFTYKTPMHKHKKIRYKDIKPTSLQTISNSKYLPRGSELKVYFNNISKVALKRSLSGLLLSTLLILAVVSCLFYLLKVIKDQKQLAEVKNDLISNITHEFKTPIATIGVALESIKDFNVIEDKEKTKKYLNMSNSQLSKLNTMVEKLLETATLDSESLELNKENIDLAEMLQLLLEKHRLSQENKTIDYNSNAESILTMVDVFHMENAINNVLDNAIKYGGDKINVQLEKTNKSVLIAISDNGNSLTKENKDRIFEKFYRITKGNTHDVKGFGIGLYYTKTIVEKHNGLISLDLKNGLTSFNISLPYAR